MRLMLALAMVAVGLLAALGGHFSRLQAPPPSQLFEDRNGRFLAQFGTSLRSVDARLVKVQLQGRQRSAGFGFWPLGELPERVVAATLALEDRRFWTHPGIDPIAVARAATHNLLSGKRLSGASTIAMQVARMQVSRQLSGRRGYGRKLLEAATAVIMTLRHGREAMLRQYLQLVPYANRIHGIAYAARIYLAKPVEDLSWAEIAFLAAIPQAPSLSNPHQPRGRERARRRGLRILERLAHSGVIDDVQWSLAQTQLKRLRVQARPQRPYAAMHIIAQLPALRKRAVAPSGPRPLALNQFEPDHGTQQVTAIRTSIDLDLQGRVHDLTATRLHGWRRAGAGNAAVVVIDLQDVSVRALLGSDGYDKASDSGAINFAQIKRSPGSTLKPFIYALALDRKLIQPDTVLDDLPGAAGIANADRRFLGPMLPRQALANSRNLPAARLVKALGVEQTYWALQPLGLHAGESAAKRYGLGLALGAMPASLTQLMSAYAALARDGWWRPLRYFDDAKQPVEQRVLSAASARLITSFLSDPQARLPTFKRMGATRYPMPVALKTGTSQGYRDAWTFAWTAHTLVGVWVGRADARSMLRLGGANSAAWLARDVLLAAAGSTPTSAPARNSFLPPPGHQRVALCAFTGTAAGPGCGRVALEWLSAKPQMASYTRVAIDSRTARVASAMTPASFVKVRDFPTIAPRFRAWAASQEGLLPMASTGNAASNGSLRSQSSRLTITSPTDGLRVLRVPDMPAHTQTLPLRAHSLSGERSIVWYVDGQPFKLSRADATVRWPLVPGRHRIQVRFADDDSLRGPVRVTVD